MGSRLTRYTAKIFGSTATLGQLGVFGSLADASPTTATTPAQVMSLSNWLAGWYSAVLGLNAPALQDMNGAFFALSYLLAYVMEVGISDWDSGTTYFTNDFVQANGIIYVSVADNNTSALTVSGKWKILGGKSYTMTGAATANAYDNVVLLDATSGAFNASLPPSANADGAKITFKRINTNANVPTLVANGSDVIVDRDSGDSTYPVADIGDSVTIVCSAANAAWYVI